MTAGRHLQKRQSGAAILMAMLTVTLVATLAVGAMWQQWRSSEIEAAQRARVQSSWILAGALDWARLILIEDARAGGADHLAEPWAVPLEEARLTTFFASESSASTSQDDVQQAFISGRIEDGQAHLNVFNLVDQGVVSRPALAQFEKLFDLLGLPGADVARLAENLRFAQDTSPDNRNGAQAALLPQRIDQLVWLGVAPQSLALLAPFITLLPERTPVNLNTAPAEVVYAAIPSIDMAGARQFVSGRTLSHFQSLGDASKALGERGRDINDSLHSVTSRYFEVVGRLRLDQTVVSERSLVQRDGLAVRALWRERVAAQIRAPSQTPQQAASLQ